MSEQNVDLVRRAYESFNRWGLDPSVNPEVTNLLHPEVEFHTYANSPEAGIYRGRDAVIEYNQRLFAQFESVRIELEELLPADDRVVVISRQHAVGRTGHTPIVVQVVEAWTIRDGLLAERHTFSSLPEALEAVGLPDGGA
jgi:ketosteroid isomerase-like protein